MHGAGMDSIRSKLFNSSVADRTSDSLVSTADSTTADCNKGEFVSMIYLKTFTTLNNKTTSYKIVCRTQNVFLEI